MNHWFSSDLHSHHKAVMEFCPDTRRGENAEEMTELMLEKFNEYVGPDDHLILLGDVSFGGRAKVENFISRLPGKKMLVLGNHDFIIKRRDEVILEISELWVNTCQIEVQKDFALAVKDTPYSGVMFQTRKTGTLFVSINSASDQIKREWLGL